MLKNSKVELFTAPIGIRLYPKEIFIQIYSNCIKTKKYTVLPSNEPEKNYKTLIKILLSKSLKIYLTEVQ